MVALLFGAVAAEDGYTCIDSNTAWVEFPLSNGEVTTADLCKAACETNMDSMPDG